MRPLLFFTGEIFGLAEISVTRSFCTVTTAAPRPRAAAYPAVATKAVRVQ